LTFGAARPTLCEKIRFRLQSREVPVRHRALHVALRRPALFLNDAGPGSPRARSGGRGIRTAPRLMAVVAAALAGLTCDLVTSPKARNIHVDYAGTTRLVVGTVVSFPLSVTDNGVPVDHARLSVDVSDTSVLDVHDVDAGFTFTLHAKRRGSATVGVSLVSSTLTDAPPSAQVRFITVAASLAIDTSSVTFSSLNDTMTLAAAVRDDNGAAIPGAAADVRWSSSAPAIATVDASSGRLTARGNGTALIVATIDSTVTDTATITVEQRLTRYAFTPGSLVLAALTQDTPVVVTPLDARGTPISGATLPTPVFSTLNAGVVTVTAGGRVTSTGNGATGIRVQGPGTVADDTLAVTVGQVATRVEIAGPRADTIEALQDTLLLRATAADAQGVEVRGRGVTWFSRQSALAQVNPASGWIRGVGVGTTTIVAQLDAAADSIAIAVRNVPRSVRTTPSVLLTTVGDSVALADTAFNRLGAAVSNVAITWAALDPSIASVGAANGVLVARSIGTTLVIGTIEGGYADTTSVAVENRVAALDLTQPDTSLGSVGDTITVRATIANARGAPLPLSAVAWSVADSSVLSLSNGFVTALRAGFSNVYAVDRLNPARRDSVRITVTNAPVNVLLNRILDTLTAPTRTLQYDVVARNARGAVLASPAITWRATNASVASVSPAGLATALAVGMTQIVAEAGSGAQIAADTATLVVTNDAVSLAVSPTDVTIPSVGATVALGADVRNIAGGSISNVTFQWSSSDTAVARVSSSGVVTGLGVGTATVTVRLAALSAFAKITVTNAPDLIDIVPTAVTLASVDDTVIPAATLQNALGASLPRTAAQWLSDDALIAQVTADGAIIAVGRGATTIRARNALNAARQDSVAATVTNAPDSLDVIRTVDSLPSLNRTITYTADVFNARHRLIPNEPVTWTSRSPSVATISSAGIATSVGIGATYIVGTAGVAKDSALLIVSNRASTVTISPSTLALHSVGDTARLTAVARNELGNVIAGAVIAWTAVDSTVATVSSGGLVTAAATGTTNIHATADAVTASVTVTVANDIATLNITSGDVTLASVGDLVTLTADVRNALGASLPSSAAVWATGDANVATVSGSGLVTATGSGRTTVSATSPTNSLLTSAVTVTVTNAPVSIALNRSVDTLTALGRTLTYTAVVRNARGDLISNAAVGWTSSNPGVASVGAQTGLATALAVGGPVTVTATTSNGLTATAMLVVSNDAVSISLTPDSASILNLGGTLQMTALAPNDLNNPVPASVITWLSLDADHATVSTGGLVTATTDPAKVGTARVVASVNSPPRVKADTSYITVANAPTTVSITSGAITLASVGDTVRPAATIASAAGALPRTAVNWTSSATNVATVTNAGLVTAQGAGVATITATSPYNPLVTSSVTITVTNAPASVVLSASAVTLTALTRTTTFTAVVRNQRGDPITGQSVNFTSSDVGRVSVGLTTGIATAVDTTLAGNPVTITAAVASAPTVTTTATVTVTNRPSSVALAPTSLALTAVGATALLTSTSRNDLGNIVPDAPVAWATSNGAVVAVPGETTRDTGRVTALAVGSATVTVTSNALTASTTVTVTNDLDTLQILPASGSVSSLQDTLFPAVRFRNSLGASLPRDAATWSSSNVNVATVSSTGVITGVGVGAVVVYAVSPANAAIRDSMQVTVANAAASVVVSPSGPDTLTGLAQQLTYAATVRNARGAVITGASVTWNSSAGAATVDQNGVATAATDGATSITATSGSVTSAGATLVVNTSPSDWYVNKDAAVTLRVGTLARPFSRIQDALNVATTGNTVWIKRAASVYAETLAVASSITLRAYPADFTAAGCSVATGRCTAPTSLPTLGHGSGAAAIRTASGVTLTLREMTIAHTVDGPAVDANGANLDAEFVYVNPSAGSPVGRGIWVHSSPDSSRIRHSVIRQVKGYGVRLENVTNSRVDSVAVSAVDTAAWFDGRAGVHVVGGSGNSVRHSSFSGITGMDGIRLSGTREAALAGDTVTGGRNAVRADSSSAATSGLVLSGGTTGFLLSQADTVVSSGDSIGGTTRSCVRVSGAAQVDSLKAAMLGNCATGSADSAAITVSGAGAHFATVNTRFTNMNRRLIRFVSGRALHVSGDTMVTSGLTPGTLDSAVVTATAADTVRITGSVITDHRRRPALNLAASTQLYVDHNRIARNGIGIRLAATLPPSGPDRWVRNNDIYDHDTAGATGFPVDSLLLKNWWGDTRGPARRFLFATLFDSTAAGDSVAAVQDSAGYLSRDTSALYLGSVATGLRRMRGDGQSATGGEVLPLPLTVRVIDAAGRPVRGVTVEFVKSATFTNNDDLDVNTAGNDDVVSVTSDSSGVAEIRPQLAPGGGGTGDKTITVRRASAPAITVSFTVTKL
jgi:uncharacterized protein YjdB